jgi:hypothetical protein
MLAGLAAEANRAANIVISDSDANRTISQSFTGFLRMVKSKSVPRLSHVRSFMIWLGRICWCARQEPMARSDFNCLRSRPGQ